ncbi:AChain A [Histomonas meleagridis]|uniref:AChain A n=1 Tax=Histomonas meleagridis TaxID=135588 RepID=UPI003559E423|nr:AChain A [Histomonas meleagridis]KAH0804014.1 AChain A [Histomonas meleagridis]
MDKNKEKHFFGIDLGTTYSSIALSYDNYSHIECISDDYNNMSIPSYVTIQKDNILIGESAKQQYNPESTLYDIKRLIGRPYNNFFVQCDKKNWPFKVVCGDDNLPSYEIRFDNETKRYSPIEVSSYILNSLKQLGSEYIGLNPNDTDTIGQVITVPAYFNSIKRDAVMEAGKLAGLNVVQIIDEPIAEAIAFCHEEESISPRKLLVVDFGGSTLDLTILQKENNSYTILAIGGDMYLGGQDIDYILTEYFAKRFEDKFKQNIHEDKYAMFRLKMECEKAKKFLSHCNCARISCPPLYNGIDFTDSITRPVFEDLIKGLLSGISRSIDNVFIEARLHKEDIDGVILVGGSSKIPCVRKMLTEMFEDKIILNRSIDPEKAVTFGAALLARSNEAKKEKCYNEKEKKKKRKKK